jgi:L-alanine-DL-glutamate epimerase-like enolase superfamily enzyme
VPHSPRAGMEQAPVVHYLAAIANPGPFHEFKATEHVPRWECDIELEPDKRGTLHLPTGAGFGSAIVATSLGALTVV